MTEEQREREWQREFRRVLLIVCGVMFVASVGQAVTLGLVKIALGNQ